MVALALGPGDRPEGRCGRGSVGRASPCQGEGRGFESRRPLGEGLTLSTIEIGSCRWSGREARQRTANPCTRVQIPAPPRAAGAAVARFPDTEEVTGSIPVSPTSRTPGRTRSGVFRCPGCDPRVRSVSPHPVECHRTSGTADERTTASSWRPSAGVPFTRSSIRWMLAAARVMSDGRPRVEESGTHP
jgi:hypothetical protein